MLKWEIKNGVIASLKYKDEELINPWGIETADSWSFFSLERGIGYRYKNLSLEENFNETQFSSTSHIKMHEGEWALEINDEIQGNKIVRTAKLTCLEDSYFMDFVVRFRFKKDFFNQARIAGQNIQHTASNVYHQYPVGEASLKGDHLNIDVRLLKNKCQEKFNPHLYVRDHNDEWVIHARMIPSVEDKNIIKLCSKYFKTSPLPQLMTNALLLFPFIKKGLWYRGEHTPYKSKLGKFFSPNAFPLVHLKKGDELYWAVEMEVNGR